MFQATPSSRPPDHLNNVGLHTCLAFKAHPSFYALVEMRATFQWFFKLCCPLDASALALVDQLVNACDSEINACGYSFRCWNGWTESLLASLISRRRQLNLGSYTLAEGEERAFVVNIHYCDVASEKKNCRHRSMRCWCDLWRDSAFWFFTRPSKGAVKARLCLLYMF